MYEFGPGEILKGSGVITRQCSDNTEITLGSVYAAELRITLLTDVDRYTLFNGKVEVMYHLRVSESTDPGELDGDSDLNVGLNGDFNLSVEPDGIYEAVPMGVFEISEANRKGRCLEIRAYDYMLRFDRSFQGVGTYGTAFDFLSYICRYCRVELAMRREEVEALPNGSVMLSVYEENDIETCRDVLFYVAQVLGCFAVIGRDGRLTLRRFRTEAVLTVTDRHRFQSSFSDFVTRYTAVSSTNLRTEIAEYYALETDDGLTMNLGVNPLMQFSLQEMRERVVQRILAAVAVIDYVPFESDTIGNPAIDLGDVLVFSGGSADESKVSMVTHMEIRIGGKEKLRCVGKNPRLASAKSKNDKNITGLLSQIEQTAEAGHLNVLPFVNVAAYEIGATLVRIAGFEFVLSAQNHVLFFAQVVIDVSCSVVTRNAEANGTIVIPWSSGEPEVVEEPGEGEGLEEPGEGAQEDDEDEGGSGDGTEIQVSLPVTWTEPGLAVLEVMYELNGEEVQPFRPVDTVGEGKHLITLFCSLSDVAAERMNTFRVYLRMSGGTGVIGLGDLSAVLMGQAMMVSEPWDGVIEMEDIVGRAGLSLGNDTDGMRGIGLSVVFSDEMGIRMYEPMPLGLSDVAARVGIGGWCAPVEME